MALLDNVFKQRMVGALVLIALAVIFLPMLFSRQDETRRVHVDVPSTPQAPTTTQIKVDPVSVPEPQALPQEPVPSDEELARSPAQTAATPVVQPSPTPAPVSRSQTTVAKAAPATPAAPAKPAAADTSHIDVNGLSVSWSVQLASLSNRDSADAMQKTLRAQGYNAYIRSSDGMNRVFVGPLIERAEADRLRDQLGKQQKLKGFVVRFQPERN
ncbi:SPOR domain-containing protein [Pseudomonas sp. CCI3.2]|uniref:SPOR domain-containing protein n=1 Tax=unclassified Pseudomonas TaxID=196821 RepID=UPI002AC94C63|nr:MULTISPECIES: SPOR domain-containing protein [unclassified Pseudomonas]MEB0079470.1 SPOR domain-containing protein [Pseudomonas sp. MH10out]MEB0093319.1 SPOR domain-containing protein [Pseudomonas sp. CCI4.2]MEB0102505.1 SPOR domain-containing protein [Pseudomonas sp. CCI3.2]MEB0132441.1 SPOR domain-containing protein [Pseudomonas sp. CCI2.4]MEB0159213.1 SPOR domain-containing protein [Pseudomonas sp. AH2 (2023)]